MRGFETYKDANMDLIYPEKLKFCGSSNFSFFLCRKSQQYKDVIQLKKDCIHCVSIIPFPFSLALFSASTHIVSICLLSFRLTLTFMCIIIIIIIIRISSFADVQFKHNKQVIRINFVNIKAYCLSQVYNPVCQHIQISPQQKK